jgi:hypothetical protein
MSPLRVTVKISIPGVLYAASGLPGDVRRNGFAMVFVERIDSLRGAFRTHPSTQRRLAFLDGGHSPGRAPPATSGPYREHAEGPIGRPRPKPRPHPIAPETDRSH